LAVWAR
jgi:hypothetical protein